MVPRDAVGKVLTAPSETRRSECQADSPARRRHCQPVTSDQDLCGYSENPRLAHPFRNLWNGDSEPATPNDVGAVRSARRSLDPQGPGPAPMPERSLLRQAPEVGAVCGNSARTDLRGATPARAFPTATLLSMSGSSLKSKTSSHLWAAMHCRV